MKKFFKIFVFILVILVVFLFCLLFTQIGNNILKPVVEGKIKETSGLNIKLDKFSVRFNRIDIEAVFMDSIKGKIFGSINLPKLSYDLDYTINADKLPEIGGIITNEPFKLFGKITGGIKELNADGAGDIFGAALNFNAILYDFKPIKVNVDAKELYIAKVLTILGQPTYSDGVVSLHINANPNEKGELVGGAKMELNGGILYKKALQKELGLTLLKDVTYSAGADFILVEDGNFAGKMEVSSSLVSLQTTSTNYNINSSSISTDFTIALPNLKEFESLVGTSLLGSLKLYGDAQFDKNNLKLTLKSDNLTGGKLEALVDNDKFAMKLSDIKLENVFKMLSKPDYTHANLNAKVNLTSFKNGNLEIELKNGILNANVFKKELNLTIPNSDFSSKIEATLTNGTVDFKVNFLSNLVNLQKLDGAFDKQKKELKSTYLIDINDLSKLDGLIGQKIFGSLSAHGDIKYEKYLLSATLKSDNLAGGKLDASLGSDNFSADIIDVKLEEVLKMLAKPNYASGVLNAKINMDSISNKNGNFDVDIANGRLNNNTIKKEFNLTLSNNDFSANASAVMKNGIADFNAKVLSSLANIDEFTGTFNFQKYRLKSSYRFGIKDLSKLNSITKQNMVGSLVLDGAVNYQNDKLRVDGKSSILGGEIKFDFADTRFILKGEKLSALDGLKMLSYPAVFDAKIDLNMNYDINKSDGTFNATSPSGRLMATQLSNIIKTFSNLDITSDVYENILLKGKINSDNINFLFNMKGKQSNLTIKDGKIAGDKLNIPYTMFIGKTDLVGKIGGTTSDPTVSLDTSEYLKNKAQQEIEKQIKKNGDKILNSIIKAL